jgi:hypothetical protein
MITSPEKNRRGRPTGWRKPNRRERGDFRFTPETWRILEEYGSDDKTAYVEKAIAHYATSQQQAAQAQAIAYQARIDDLLAQLDQAHRQTLAYEAEIRDLHAKLAAPVAPAPVRQSKKAPAPKPVKQLNPTKAYQIIIKHEQGQPCPALPQGFAYDEHDKTVGLKGALDIHTTHTILNEEWPVAKIRKELDRLKGVSGITGLWIACLGLALRAPSGRPTNMWHRNERGTWEKDN